MPERKTKTPTADRLRHDIDSGRAGDKVPFIDPAAAPLGTDEEAGGHPPSAQQRQWTQQAEANPSGAFSPVDERGRTISGELTTSSWFWIYVAIAAVVLIGIVGFVLAR